VVTCGGFKGKGTEKKNTQVKAAVTTVTTPEKAPVFLYTQDMVATKVETMVTLPRKPRKGHLDHRAGHGSQHLKQRKCSPRRNEVNKEKGSIKQPASTNARAKGGTGEEAIARGENKKANFPGFQEMWKVI